MRKNNNNNNNDRLKRILSSSADFDSIEDAIAADLVSVIPVVGEITDFLRVLDSETKPQKGLQALDLLTDPIPIVNLATPTNTLLYLDKRGLLPMPLDSITQKIESMTRTVKTPMKLSPLRKRNV